MTNTIYCSIGENCLPHDVIKRRELPLIVTPFAHGRSNIDYVLSLARENFVDLLNPSLLERRTVYGKPVVKHLKYQCATGVFDSSVADCFEFTHHDVMGSEKDRESYQRKAERFITAVMGSQDPIVCLYHHRGASQSSLTYVESQLLRFKDLAVSRRGADNITIVLFYQSIVEQDGLRRVEITDGQITKAAFFTRKTWGGSDQDVFWGKVDDDLFDELLSGFRLSDNTVPASPENRYDLREVPGGSG